MFPFKPNAAQAMPPSMGMGMPFQAPNAFNGFSPIAKASQGFLPQLSGLAGNTGGGGSQIVGMIGQLQRVIQTANKVMPMVQQYGPMVKNVPSMIKMMREFKKIEKESNDDNSTHEDQAVETNEAVESGETIEAAKTEVPIKSEGKQEQPKKIKLSRDPKPSTPKMYV